MGSWEIIWLIFLKLILNPFQTDAIINHSDNVVNLSGRNHPTKFAYK